MMYFSEILICTTILLIFAAYRWYYSKRSSRFPPGPVGLPLVGYLPFLKGHPSEFGKIARKYGSIFSIKLGSFDVVILNDAELIRKAFRQDVFSGRPQAIVAMAITSGGISFNEGIAWDQQRRFTLKVLRQLGFGKSVLESSLQGEVSRLVSHLRANSNKSISLKRIFQISVLNTLWSIVASKQYAYDDPEALYMHKICYEGFIEPEVAGPVWFMPWLAKLAPIWSGFRALEIATEKMQEIFLKLIRERQKTFAADRLEDFIDYYLLEISKVEDPKSTFYKEAGVHSLTHVLIDLFTAGSDTTSSTLSFAILYLLHNPKVMSKLRSEIDSVVPHGVQPAISDRPNMPYTEATLAEIFRMSSIVCGALLHSTMAKTEFEGYELPKSTIVMSNLWEVHHDPKNWKDPSNFRPERFLDKNGSFQKNELLMPFGTGKRICPAENLASTNFFLFLTSLVQNFDFEFDNTAKLPTLEPKTGLVLSTQDYNVILKPRF